jgi:hypothetical protein
MQVDTSLCCHIDDTDALIADMNLRLKLMKPRERRHVEPGAITGLMLTRSVRGRSLLT